MSAGCVLRGSGEAGGEQDERHARAASWGGLSATISHHFSSFIYMPLYRGAFTEAP